MDALACLLTLLFASDVAALGSPSFAERHAAHRRLESVGAWAMPALLDGIRDADQERQWRCRVLLERAGWKPGDTLLDSVVRRCYFVRAALFIVHRAEYGEHLYDAAETDARLRDIAADRPLSLEVFRLAAAGGVRFSEKYTGRPPTEGELEGMDAEGRYWVLWSLCGLRQPIPPLPAEKP